ncbi:HAD family hydrolase [Sutcliffiella rhizosphaerae]|uniref:Phosphoglycolate phosphatase n=1 Tax=Sutcliffiella rhizosphaerae TaxID=2880967 RepID=A0ABM8YPP3_9BACI|nr:HAD family hydrolase [Sutcliffiella rhizosphaerae]CAG9621899.1 Phosphoglycolate phosphatase [Sutcliffiella rhizosphaerae]
MIKAVIFDLDGTLLDREQSIEKFVWAQYDKFSSAFLGVSQSDYVKRFIELDEKGYVWKDKVYQQLIDVFNITSVTWEELLQDYWDNFSKYCVPFEGLTTTLDFLYERKIQLGIISNGYTQFQLSNIGSLNIRNYFQIICISENEGTKKPEAAIFNNTLAKIGVVASECIYVGDHSINDIRGANEVGMKTIWKEVPEWDQTDADYTIKNLKEITEIIQALISKEDCDCYINKVT